jgi:16S rRNA (adenine1518-N6/adenine1519-N6)-dimethyltransferase
MTEVIMLGPADVRSLADRLGVYPTKKLGQNFVHDANTVRKIVALAKVQPGETVLEVGPGLGSLTLGLVEADADVIAVEIDKRLAAELQTTIAGRTRGRRITVVSGDALALRELPAQPVRLVANLPYNISVPVLLHLLEHFASIRSGVVMVQAEVGHRLAAEPGSKVYGSPSVKAAWYGQWKVVGTVSRSVFWPVPNVDSVLIGFERWPVEMGRGIDPAINPAGFEASEQLRKHMFEIIDRAFGQRRKMLRQALAIVYGSPELATRALEAADIDPTMRGEQLGIDAYIRLARTDLARA